MGILRVGQAAVATSFYAAHKLTMPATKNCLRKTAASSGFLSTLTPSGSLMQKPRGGSPGFDDVKIMAFKVS